MTGSDLENTVVTADAAHTQHANGAWLRWRNAHYIAAVKGNHPGLLARLKRLPWKDIRLISPCPMAAQWCGAAEVEFP
jgi:hypothetical protein